MLDPQREIQALVDNFVDDLSELAKRIAIEQIKSAFELGAPALPPYTAAPSSAGTSAGRATAGSASPTPGRRGRRPARELEGLRERLLAAITAQPGRRTEDLNLALGTQTPQIAPVLRKLVIEEQVRTEGARRGTRYFANAGGSQGGSGGSGGQGREDEQHGDDDDQDAEQGS